MGDEELKFLRALRPDGEPTGNWFLPLASRSSDAARSKLKRLGFVKFDRKNWAWRITDAGRLALSEATGRDPQRVGA